MGAFGALANEFRVNTTTGGRQSVAAVAMDDGGGFVVAWQDENQAGNRSITGQRYNADGTPIFGEFQINGTSQTSPQSPAIAMDADGDFVVVWAGTTLDQGSTLISAQRFNNAGLPQGNTFIVSVFSGVTVIRPSVAMDSDGDFVIAWEREISDTDIDVYARRYNALGVAQASEFLVHAANTAKQSQPSVAMDAAGTFIVTWVVELVVDADIYARHFNAAGVAQGNEFRVNTDTTDAQTSPSIAADNIGNYVITWNGEGTGGDDSDQWAQRYNASDVAQGTQFLVNVTTNGVQGPGSVTMSNDGKFLIIWINDSDVFGRMYDTTGAAMSGEFTVNNETEGIQGHYPALAMDVDGTHTIVTWTHYGTPSSAPDIYARRFSTNVASPTVTPPPATTIPTVTTTITENEFYAAFEQERTAFPDIAQGIADFVPNGINMTISVIGSEVGVVSMSVSNANGFITLNITSFGEVNGVTISQSYIHTVNRDLPLLITATLEAILIERFGANQNVESVVIDNTVMTVTLQNN